MAKTATPPPVTTGRIAAIFAGIMSIDPAKDRFGSTMKVDKLDYVVGKLSDNPPLERLVLFRNRRKAEVVEIVEAINDLAVAHDQEHTHLGRELPHTSCRAFEAAVSEKMKELRDPANDYNLADAIAQGLILMEYGHDRERPVIGFREDGQIVYRARNDRGDVSDPLDDLHESVAFVQVNAGERSGRGSGLGSLLGLLSALGGLGSDIVSDLLKKKGGRSDDREARRGPGNGGD